MIVKNNSLCRYTVGQDLVVRNIITKVKDRTRLYDGRTSSYYLYREATLRWFQNNVDIDSDDLVNVELDGLYRERYVERHINVFWQGMLIGNIHIVVLIYDNKLLDYHKRYYFNFTRSLETIIIDYLNSKERYDLSVSYNDGKIVSIKKERVTRERSM